MLKIAWAWNTFLQSYNSSNTAQAKTQADFKAGKKIPHSSIICKICKLSANEFG